MKIENGTEKYERWFPSKTDKKPKEFTYKSPDGVWFKSQEEFYKMLSEVK